MVLAMAQANVSMPMAAMGLQFGPLLAWSVVGGLIAAAATYYVFGRGLSNAEEAVDETLHHPVAESAKGVLDVINRAGAEAFKIAVGALPMLVLSLTVVLALRRLGALDLLTQLLSPALVAMGADPALLLPTLTKFLAGGTAMMGVMDEMLRAGTATTATLNGASAGMLVHPLDIPGVAVLLSAGRRVAAVWKPAALGALVGIAVRMGGHMLLA
jgi:spore maturation protein SpmB